MGNIQINATHFDEQSTIYTVYAPVGVGGFSSGGTNLPAIESIPLQEIQYNIKETNLEKEQENISFRDEN